MKKVSILGSTGSIGSSTLKIIKDSNNLYNVFALAAHSNIDKLQQQALEFKPKLIVVYDEKKAKELRKRLPNIKILSSIEGLIEIASHPDVDFVMSAMSSSIGLIPTIEAIKANKVIGLANKEVLVAAGDLVNQLIKRHKTVVIPVDSEHSAIFQCMKNENHKFIKRLVLTASGGPFLNYTKEQMQTITVKEALNHPNFQMGKKITVDSSTLMNKGLELIEAYYLFNISQEQIDIVVHHQQIIHSMVEFVDGSILAQMSEPGMEIPIRYALSYPNRDKSKIKSFDFIKNCSLTFSEPDYDKFLCLSLALQALKAKKSMPCFMNKANEILVLRFLQNEISWQDIALKLEKLMSLHTPQNLIDLSSVLDIEKEAENKARNI
ncbi:MAG: hypothetical protein ACD_7C00256G0001 [uncultured bacterium]|nr:MAG: hypothetical protein ACD_7C00256G0001 [uncultured bacterium]